MKCYLPHHPKDGWLQEVEESQTWKIPNAPPHPSFFFLSPPSSQKNIHIRSIITLAKTDSKVQLCFNHSLHKAAPHQTLDHQMNWWRIIHFSNCRFSLASQTCDDSAKLRWSHCIFTYISPSSSLLLSLLFRSGGSIA